MGDSAHIDGELTEVAKRWQMALSGYTLDEIGVGIKSCAAEVANFRRAGDEAWPPGYAEFTALCRPRRHGAAAYKPFTELHPRQIVDPARMREEMAKMREAVR